MPNSVLRVAIDSWRLGLRAITAMPLLSGGALAGLLASLTVASLISGEVPPSPPSAADFISWLVFRELVNNVIIASFSIAVHRFVILEEVADRPIWWLPVAFRGFFGWCLLFGFLLGAPHYIFPIFGPSHLILYNLFNIGCMVLVFIFFLRVILLFPVLALATESADWRHAWKESAGHGWEFFGIVFVACLPLVVVAGIFGGWIYVSFPSGGVGLLLNALGGCIWILLQSSICAAAASRLLQIYGCPPSGHGDTGCPATVI